MNAQFYWTLISMCDNYKVELNSKEFKSAISFVVALTLFREQMIENYPRTVSLDQ